MENMLLSSGGEGRITSKGEIKFRERAKEKGWQIIKSGWPDFLCYKVDDNGKITEAMFVEVKQDWMDNLRKNQGRMLQVLNALGLQCYVYSEQHNVLRHIEDYEIFPHKQYGPRKEREPKQVSMRTDSDRPPSCGSVNRRLRKMAAKRQAASHWVPLHTKTIRQKLCEKH